MATFSPPPLAPGAVAMEVTSNASMMGDLKPPRTTENWGHFRSRLWKHHTRFAWTPRFSPARMTPPNEDTECFTKCTRQWAQEGDPPLGTQHLVFCIRLRGRLGKVPFSKTRLPGAAQAHTVRGSRARPGAPPRSGLSPEHPHPRPRGGARGWHGCGGYLWGGRSR